MSNNMKSILMQWLTALALLLSANAVQAALSCIDCTVASLGFSASVSTASTAASFTITRANSNGTVNYSVAPNGSSRTAASGSNVISYSLATNSACSTAWTALTGTIGNGPSTATSNFWGCISTPAVLPPAGTYTDTVLMTATYSGGGQANSNTNSFPVIITVPASCTITSSPGTVAFTYTAFQTSAATASTTFGVTCNSSLPYNMAVSPTSSTLVGISYSLSVPASGTGTGMEQTQTISGTAAAGQAGTCATGTCSGIQSTTLTITY